MESQGLDSFRVIKLSPMPLSHPGFKPYQAMVFSNYLNSLRFNNPWFKKIDSRTYYQTYHALLERLLSRHDCTVRIAVLSDDPDVALGWSISRPDVLDFVFVKRDGRKQGIGRALLPPSFSTVTHITHLGELLLDRLYPSAKFDPFQ